MRRRAVATIALLILTAGVVYAERFPVVQVSTAQGLASNTIHKIVRDSRGFLWFCTGDGLSRYDGHQFANFRSPQALPGAVVWDFAEGPEGDYWAATSGGLVHIAGDTYSFEVVNLTADHRQQSVLAVNVNSDNTVWVGADRGLYRIQRGSGVVAVDTGPLPESWSQPTISVLEEDRDGNLWFGGTAGIGRVSKAGRVDRWTPRQGFRSYVVVSLFRDSDGTIWVGTEEGLCHLRANPEPGASPTERCYGPKDGLPSAYSQSILRAGDGRLWVGTLEGAAFAASRTDGNLVFNGVSRPQGLFDNNIEALAEDVAGNIWLGAADDGAMKLSANGVALFTEADGLSDSNVIAFFEDQQGRLVAVTRSPSGVALNRFDGKGFLAMQPAKPERIRAFGRGFQQVALQDHAREWWIGTGDGLLRYRAGDAESLRKLPEVLVITSLPDGANVFRLFEDSRGDVWWSTSSRITNTLARWSRTLSRVVLLNNAAGLPSLQSNLPSAFVEDGHGKVWMGFESQGLARQRSDGTFEYFDPASYWPIRRTRVAYRDKKGRLWFGAATGLWRLDNPDAVKPSLTSYTAPDALSSSTVFSICEDPEGRIYVGTASGLDRLDPESGQIEHFPSPDGFPTGTIQAAYRDRSGILWFATRHGAMRFDPGASSKDRLPHGVWITTMKVRGTDFPLSAAGAAAIAGVQLRPGEDQVEFGFTAPSFQTSEELLYQYSLESSRPGKWSPLSNSRSVNFANLPPGSYRFLVRAVDPQGIPSAVTASVAFRILPSFWLTWWFRTAIGLVIAVAVYMLYRYRMTAMVERERLRFRIATDLHDDIGASLSTIAIWSELAAQKAAQTDNQFIEQLEQIGARSREVIDSVSDIVWAINPQHDRFADLASRMRHHVGDLLAAVQFPISFTVEGEERVIGPILRREVFLVFKEALNNVVRHSQCTTCSVDLRLTSDRLVLRIADDGIGFKQESGADGNGLESMRNRAKRLGGALRMESALSHGTVIELDVPARRLRRPWRKFLRI